MQNSRNAREAELPAELPQVPLMLPNRRHGHQSSPSCLQKIDRASPEQPRHAANGRMAAATAPEFWRLARHACDCGLADLSMRQGRGAQNGDHLHPGVPTLWAAPRSCHSYQCRRQGPRSAGAKARAQRQERREAALHVPHVLPAEPPQFHSMLPKSPAQPPRIPHSACKFARAAQSSPDMPPNGRTAAAAAPESWRLARHVRDCGSTALACAKAMAHRIGDHLHPSIPTLWAGPRNTPRDLAFATGTDTKANTVTKFTQHRQLAITAASM